MSFQVGDICVILNEKKPQSWLVEEVGKLVRVTRALEHSPFVYVEKLDGTTFNRGADLDVGGNIADVWNDNLELTNYHSLECAECHNSLDVGVVDYLCQECRDA